MEEKMKEKKEVKLRLKKTTIQHLETLTPDEQNVIKGGDEDPKHTTIVPVYC
jgi:hypothetical protein